jgi:hypothetical protein
MMKGLELPMNMIVVILIAVLVLVVLGAFFAGQTGGGIDSINRQNAFGSACTRFRTIENCANANFETSYIKPGDTKKVFFLELCTIMGYSASSGDNSCAKACGCVITP